MTLEDLGWNDRFAAEFAKHAAKGWVPARLIRDNKIAYGAILAGGEEVEVSLGGSVYHAAETDAALPSVGDWVAIEMGADENQYDAVIRARLERHTCLSRKAPGKSTEEQVIAVNIDVVCVVTDAGQDFNERRMERYFEIMQRSGARSVALINKSDLYSPEANQKATDTLRRLSPETEIFVTSAVECTGVDVIRYYLKPGVTIALIGSSGVGKSSLINQLIGQEWLWTGDVNAVTGKGTHTTTARELLCLRRGGMLIDNPGIREVHMWTDKSSLKASFSDFDAIAKQCKYHDCKHGSDKGCAVQTAIADGTLCKERFINYLKLDFELERLSRRKKKHQVTLGRRNRRDLRSKGDRYGE